MLARRRASGRRAGAAGLLEVSEEASPRTLGTRKNWKPQGRWGMRARLPVHARKEFFRLPVRRPRPFIRPSPRPWPRPLAPLGALCWPCHRLLRGLLVQAAPGPGARAFSAGYWGGGGVWSQGDSEEVGASNTSVFLTLSGEQCGLIGLIEGGLRRTQHVRPLHYARPRLFLP